METIKGQIKNDIWVDDQGQPIPASRIMKFEKNTERTIVSVINKALKCSEAINNLKNLLEEKSKDLIDLYSDNTTGEYNYDKSFTYFSFDKSLKIERVVSKQFDFDEIKLKESFNLFKLFLSEGDIPVVISNMITDAFSSKKSFDKNKITKLLSYSENENIESKTFKQAIDLLKQAKDQSGSKVYFRLYMKDEDNNYQFINLNLATT